jgi:hypothetical protein
MAGGPNFHESRKDGKWNRRKFARDDNYTPQIWSNIDPSEGTDGHGQKVAVCRTALSERRSRARPCWKASCGPRVRFVRTVALSVIPTKLNGLASTVAPRKGAAKDFSVTMKTVMERSKIALHKWLQAFHLMASIKKGVSAHQIHRALQISYEAAWFMSHRIRKSMRAAGLA